MGNNDASNITNNIESTKPKPVKNVWGVKPPSEQNQQQSSLAQPHFSKMNGNVSNVNTHHTSPLLSDPSSSHENQQSDNLPLSPSKNNNHVSTTYDPKRSQMTAAQILNSNRSKQPPDASKFPKLNGNNKEDKEDSHSKRNSPLIETNQQKREQTKQLNDLNHIDWAQEDDWAEEEGYSENDNEKRSSRNSKIRSNLNTPIKNLENSEQSNGTETSNDQKFYHDRDQNQNNHHRQNHNNYSQNNNNNYSPRGNNNNYYRENNHYNSRRNLNDQFNNNGHINNHRNNYYQNNYSYRGGGAYSRGRGGYRGGGQNSYNHNNSYHHNNNNSYYNGPNGPSQNSQNHNGYINHETSRSRNASSNYESVNTNNENSSSHTTKRDHSGLRGKALLRRPSGDKQPSLSISNDGVSHSQQNRNRSESNKENNEKEGPPKSGSTGLLGTAPSDSSLLKSDYQRKNLSSYRNNNNHETNFAKNPQKIIKLSRSLNPEKKTDNNSA